MRSELRVEIVTLTVTAVLIAGWILWEAFESGQIREARYECFEARNIAACDFLEEIGELN